MTKPIFYSLPPSGHTMPLMGVIRGMKEGWKRNGENGPSLQPLSEFLGTRNILYLSSGRAALWLILKTLSRMNPGRLEVIIPAYTCPAVASAVLKAGLKPILCDVTLSDFGFSIEELRKRVNRNTLAVIVVHLFGYPANIEEVKDCCGQYNAFVVEDAAQAFGNSLLDSPAKKLGLLGDAGFFSFGRGKPINIMHGGVLVTNSEEIHFQALKIYENLSHRARFQSIKYELVLASCFAFSNPFLYWIPQRIPFLHLGETIFEPDFAISPGIDLAACLISKAIGYTEIEKAIRARNAQWYSTNMASLPLVDPAPSSNFPYLRYPLMIGNKEIRDRILARLMTNGTGAVAYYPSPLNELAGLRERLQDRSIYPNARKLAESLISLPVHGGVKQSHLRKIKSIVTSDLKAATRDGQLEGRDGRLLVTKSLLS